MVASYDFESNTFYPFKELIHEKSEEQISQVKVERQKKLGLPLDCGIIITDFGYFAVESGKVITTVTTYAGEDTSIRLTSEVSMPLSELGL